MWLISVTEGWGRSLWRWRNELELGKAVEFSVNNNNNGAHWYLQWLLFWSLYCLSETDGEKEDKILLSKYAKWADGTCTQSGFHYRREILSLGNANLLRWEMRLDFYSKGRLIFQGCILYQCLWKDKSGIKSCQCLSHMMCKLTRDPRRSVFHGCLKVTQLVSIRVKTGTQKQPRSLKWSLVP